MPAGCGNTCPKVKQKARSSPNADPTEDILNGSSKSVGKRVSNNSRSSSLRQKSVQIVGVTSVRAADSQSSIISDNSSTRESHTSTESAIERSVKNTPQVQRREQNPKTQQSNARPPPRIISRKESPQNFKQSSNHARMSSRGGSSSRSGRADWDPNGHDPCPPSCPMTKARERAQKKAELRQERLDEYLLTKGFSYFDDLCTCSSICLFKQLRRDKFVLAILKSICVFGIGIKLCEELDSWNIIG